VASEATSTLDPHDKAAEAAEEPLALLNTSLNRNDAVEKRGLTERQPRRRSVETVVIGFGFAFSSFAFHGGE